MFKLDELTARHEFEEKKTVDMESGVQVCGDRELGSLAVRDNQSWETNYHSWKIDFRVRRSDC